MAHMHSNYYYMVEGSPHMWLTCGNSINVHSNYWNMVEGTPHMWAINMHGNY